MRTSFGSSQPYQTPDATYNPDCERLPRGEKRKTKVEQGIAKNNNRERIRKMLLNACESSNVDKVASVLRDMWQPFHSMTADRLLRFLVEDDRADVTQVEGFRELLETGLKELSDWEDDDDPVGRHDDTAGKEVV